MLRHESMWLHFKPYALGEKFAVTLANAAVGAGPGAMQWMGHRVGGYCLLLQRALLLLASRIWLASARDVG